MLTRTVNAKINDLGETVEIQTIDYGFVEDDEYESDPYEVGYNLGNDCDFTTIPYIIAKKDFPAFTDALRELSRKKHPECEHNDIEKMLGDYLTDCYQTWDEMKYIFARAKIEYEMKPSIDGFFENSFYKRNQKS